MVGPTFNLGLLEVLALGTVGLVLVGGVAAALILATSRRRD
jgi:ABC-type transport system involved in cytochrome c biogenesis permease component